MPTIHFYFLEMASDSLLLMSDYVDRNSLRILFLKSHSPVLIYEKAPTPHSEKGSLEGDI